MYDQFDLLDFLNYDSNTQYFLKIEERMFLHKQISRKRNGLDFLDFPPRLEEKLNLVKAKMERTKWKYVNVKYGQDRLAYKLEDKPIK